MLTRGWLSLSWVLIVGTAAFGSWRISKVPDRDPDTEKAMADLRHRIAAAPVEEPPALKPMPSWSVWSAEDRPVSPFAATLLPRIRAEARPPIVKEAAVLPLAALPEAKASLDGVALTWALEAAAVELGPNLKPKAVKPTGLRVQRSTDRKEWKDVAALGAGATSWADAEAAPRTAYAYRVLLTAPEGAKAAAQGMSVAEARTPSDRRARLIGGDAKVAIVRVEAYNRKSRAWEGRERPARPGDELWPGGWKLSGLKFKGFRLVAEAVDDDGLARELTTD